MLVRKDIDKRVFIPIGILVGLAFLWLAVGRLVPLYQGGGYNVATLFSVLSGSQPLTFEAIDAMTSSRWTVIVKEMQNISFWGHGYSLSTTGGGVVHNIPLIIIHQIGILPAIAWVFVTAYCLLKTKWKYAWMAVIAMCVFDHYIWTQFVPFWWALVGVSTASNIKNDYIFRGGYDRDNIQRCNTSRGVV